MLDCLSHIYEKASTEDVRNMAKKELEKTNITLPSPKPKLILEPERVFWNFFTDEMSPRAPKNPGEEPSSPEEDPSGLFDDILNDGNVL
ncbi:MAG: hypothetical protein LEGION0403_FIIPPAGN_00449 [Legionella sp.]